MTPEQVMAIINLGPSAAVIIAVVYFLRFIEKRDKDWQSFIERRDKDNQTFMREMLLSRDSAMRENTEALKALLTDFREHNTWERTKIEAMELAVKDIKTKPAAT